MLISSNPFQNDPNETIQKHPLHPKTPLKKPALSGKKRKSPSESIPLSPLKIDIDSASFSVINKDTPSIPRSYQILKEKELVLSGAAQACAEEQYSNSDSDSETEVGSLKLPRSCGVKGESKHKPIRKNFSFSELASACLDLE